METVLEHLRAAFDTEQIAVWIADAAPRAVGVILVILLAFIVWKVLRRGLRFLLDKAAIDKTVASFLLTTTQYTVVVVAVLTVLSQLGVDTASIVASLGVAGLTIGFAAKDALSNVVSGLFIFWDRPFVVDDLVEIEGTYGRVDTITLRSTRVVTVDGKMLAIPNTTVVNSVVTSYTNFPNLRIDVEVTVAVDENLGRIRQLLLELIADSGNFMATPEPQVVVKALNDYNVLLEVRGWIADERQHVQARFALREQIFETLRDAGVDMPYETFALEPVTVSKAA